MTDMSVIVTGAASGMGRATAERLHGDGWSVLAVDIAADALEWAGGAGDGLRTCVADVATEDGNAAMVAAALDGFGRLNGVVLNAGVGTSGTIDEQSMDDVDRTLAVNLRGVML